MPPYTHFFGVSYLYFLAVQEELIMLLGQGIIPRYRGRNKRTLWSLSLPMITGGRDKIPWTSLEHSSYRQFDVPRNDDYAEILPPLLGFLPNFSTPDFFLLFFPLSSRTLLCSLQIRETQKLEREPMCGFCSIKSFLPL